MSKINCSATTCCYNKNGNCHSGSIKVDSRKPVDLKTVHCTSFISVHKNLESSIESECEHVICNVSECIHNKNLECSCYNIFVSGSYAKNYKNTNCCSFVAK
ncbi:DUF1540 domain-containing protein [Paeniclostridium sordellii]|uniref:DUF1540 domain-containing protein n=1 Tax=Paraclostridium sordellii TaxID=1505 RepID=UPI0012ED9530|nr:DUF1540 domain-containing protein [Paeniclostridium sordellii]MDU2687385.1 DUF1540 domain-containing protein [Paeniclostridium sordellii]MVO72235.1 DUF1540 domain-containing protein [Paeniclostridium sordellii]